MKNVLLISHVLPTPADSGGRQRTDQLCRAIQRVARLHTLFLSDASAHTPEILHRLRERYGMQAMLPAPRRAERVLASRLGQAMPSPLAKALPLLLSPAPDYAMNPTVAHTTAMLVKRLGIDVIVGRYLRGVCVADAFAHCPVVVDLDDADDQVYLSHASSGHHVRLVRWLFQNQSRRTWQAMKNPLAQSAHIWVSHPGDGKRLVELAGRNRHTVSDLPNIPYRVPACVSAAPANGRLLAVADWRHGFNKNGLQAFVDDCWPAIRRLPSLPTLVVAGSGLPPDLLKQLQAADGIDVVHSPDADALDALYEQAAFCIAPVAGGAGTSLKVLEALSRARTLVLTPSAWRGYEERLPHQHCVRIGHDASGLIDACTRLLVAPGQARVLGLNGRRLLGDRHDQAAFEAAVAAAIGQEHTREQ